MSLRGLPAGQAVRGARWRRLRYVPLTILAVCALGLAVVGGALSPTHPAQRVGDGTPAPLKRVTTSTEGELPEVCHPAVKQPATQPWLSGVVKRAAAESVWQQHSADVSSPYLQEQDGWVDWGDVQASNISQAVGRRTLTADEAQRWYDYLDGIRDELAKQDIPFYVVVAPAKWDVYPEKLPDWAQDIRGSGPLDQLLARYPDLPIVDVRQPLRDAKADHDVYSAVNPHWTDYGGWVAWDAVAACLSAASPQLGTLSAPAISGVDTEADRNEFSSFGVADPAPDWTVPVYADALKDVAITDAKGSRTEAGAEPIDMLDLPATTEVSGAQSSATALIARDSFGNAFNIPADQSFATTWQVRHNLDSAPDQQADLVALAKQHHPSVVILEVTQRYLTFVPPASGSH